MAKITQGPGGGRREHILAEAQKLFVAHGPQHVTTRQIANAVGISQPSLYAHFPTRDAIGVELCCRAFDELFQCLTTAAAGDGSAGERLYRLGYEYIAFGLRNEAAYRVAFMLDMPAEHDGGKSRVLDAGLRAFGVLKALMEAITGDEGEATQAAAQSAWASMHGLVALLLVREEFPFIDPARLVETHLRNVCRAALADPVQRSG